MSTKKYLTLAGLTEYDELIKAEIADSVNSVSELVGDTAVQTQINTAVSGKADKTYVDSQDATTLSSANSYTDTKIANILNNDTAAVDSIMELAAAMEDNADAIEALTTIAGNKVEKVDGKGLSTNDYTTEEKNKLTGIAAGAEVNVQSDWNATSGDAMILNKPTIPSKTSQLTNDSGYLTSHQDISGKADKTYVDTQDSTNLATAKDYTDTEVAKVSSLVGDTSVSEQITSVINTIPQVNWEQTDETASDYIKNKPFDEAVISKTYEMIWGFPGCEPIVEAETYQYYNIYALIDLETNYQLTTRPNTPGQQEANKTYNGYLVQDDSGYRIEFIEQDSEEVVFWASVESGPGRQYISQLYTILEHNVTNEIGTIDLVYDKLVFTKLSYDKIEMANQVESFDPKPVSGGAVCEYVSTTVADQISIAVNAIPQANWAETDESALDFIKNKPFGNLVLESIDTEIWTPENNGMSYDDDDNQYLPAYAEVVDGITYTLHIYSDNLTEGTPQTYVGTFMNGELQFTSESSDDVTFRAILQEDQGRIMIYGLYVDNSDLLYEMLNDSSYSIHLSYNAQVLTKLTYDDIEMAYEVEPLDPKPVTGAAVHDFVKYEIAYIPKPDWNVNGYGEEGYIENRPFYTEQKNVDAETDDGQKVRFDVEFVNGVCNLADYLGTGSETRFLRYFMDFAGVRFCTDTDDLDTEMYTENYDRGYSDDDLLQITAEFDEYEGQKLRFTWVDNIDEPYTLVEYLNENYEIIPLNSIAYLAVYVQGEEVHQLDEKYIPDSIARKEYVDERLEEIGGSEVYWSDIQDKPFDTTRRNVSYDYLCNSESFVEDENGNYFDCDSFDVNSEYSLIVTNTDDDTIEYYYSAEWNEDDDLVKCEFRNDDDEVVFWSDWVAPDDDGSYITNKLYTSISSADDVVQIDRIRYYYTRSKLSPDYIDMADEVIEDDNRPVSSQLVYNEISKVSTLVGDTPVIDQISEAVANMSTGADWNQNDETAKDYIKNRPFYESFTETCLLDQTLEIDSSRSINVNGITLISGKEYTVTFDGAEYTLTAWTDDYLGAVLLGNGWLAVGSYSFTGEPFCLKCIGDTVTVLVMSSGSHTMKISSFSNTVNTIDEKYIPNTIARSSDVYTKAEVDALIAEVIDSITKIQMVTWEVDD